MAVGRFISLQTKLLWGTVLVMAVVMSTLIAIVEQRQREAIVHGVRQYGIVLARDLAAVSTTPLVLYNYTLLEQHVARVDQEDDVEYAIIYDREGKVAAHSRRADLVGAVPEDADDSSPLTTGTVVVRELVIARGMPVYDFVVPLMVDQQRWGTVRVGLSRRRMETEVAETRRRLAVLAAATLVLGGLAAALVARRIARPVRRLAGAVAAVSRGDLAQRIAPTTSDEIGHLATAFNHMTGQLFEQRAALLEQRAALEAAHVELRRRFAELSDLKSYTDNIFGSLTSGIMTLDLDGRVVTLNGAAERLLGTTLAAARGRHCADVLALNPALAARLARALAGQPEPPPEPVVLERADGGTAPVEVATAALLGGEGRRLGVVAVLRDLTDVRQLEEQLRQAQKMEAVGRLAGGVAHDFNNLLTVIAGRSELVLTRLRSGDALRRDVALIRETAERATALTHQLLAFSRRTILQPAVIQLSDVVAGMKNMLARLIGEDITLVANLRATGFIKADPGPIEQVVANLVVNARDAMPRGGTLTLETADVDLDEAFARHHVAVKAGPYVRLVVRDTGTGIDAATRPHIFEPFFTTKGPGKGTGLGLAMVYGIVTQSGGHITVESEPGRGSAFTVDLPRVAAERAAPEPTRPSGEPPRGSETVLLVEDETEVRDLAREMLHRQGYTVLEAADGDEALRIGARHRDPIHLLLTDVVMPHMGGRELADRLRAERRALSVVYMSGYTDDAVIQQGVRDTVAAFLEKPFTLDSLARKVRETLDTAPRA